MEKIRSAFALRGYDAEKILQRPYFKKFCEEYQVGDKTDEEILKSLNGAETDTIGKMENKLRAVKAAHKLLNSFRRLTDRHLKRLDRYNRRRAGNKRGAPIIEYLTASFDAIELEQKFADIYFKLESEIQARYRRELANRLKQARRKAGLTQKELGDLVQVSPQGFSHYERGDRDIPTHTLARLAKVLKLSGDQILGL